MLAHKDTLDEKDAQIAALQRQIQSGLVTSSSTPHQGVATSHMMASALKIPQLSIVGSPELPRNSSGLSITMSSASTVRRGKTSPVDLFTGESNDLTWEDCYLPSRGLLHGMGEVKRKNYCNWQAT